MMKHRQKAAWFLSGILAAALAVSMVPPAQALFSRTIQVQSGVSVYLDDKKLEPKDANGNPVDVFVYNGTTYLPVRAVSEALNLPVQWDGNTQSVYLGKHTGDEPVAWLSDLTDFYSNGVTWKIGETLTDNIGNDHYHCICGTGNGNIASRAYLLNGQYSRLSGCLFQNYEHRSRSEKTIYTIYGDGKELWQGTVSGGILPINFDVDISGVLELKIVCDATQFWCYGVLGDVGLWT